MYVPFWFFKSTFSDRGMHPNPNEIIQHRILRIYRGTTSKLPTRGDGPDQESLRKARGTPEAGTGLLRTRKPRTAERPNRAI